MEDSVPQVGPGALQIAHAAAVAALAYMAARRVLAVGALPDTV